MPETKIRKPRSNRNFLTIKYKINILKNRAKPVAATDPEVSAFHANGNTGRRTVQPTRPDTFFSPLSPIAATARSPPSQRQQQPPPAAKSGRTKKIQPADYNPANGYGTAARTLIKKFNIIFCRVFVFYVLL
ncbi:hypothetical protein [Alistipes indistinctus]|uniref:hypothetical protein n=1 Tax=Alistipes indistinctus TaxID=626932 RepID=UPI00241DF300|nr:hypothetical protein [Alistipes indistinctus]